MAYLAHSANNIGETHSLADHLREVSQLAAGFAEAFGGAEEAAFMGELHDLGKYGDFFQDRLQGLKRGIDHWSDGAKMALQLLKQSSLGALASIAGHHLGLPPSDENTIRQLLAPDYASQNTVLSQPAEAGGLAALEERWRADGFGQLEIPSTSTFQYNDYWAAAALNLRMIFSCLVDADYLDTEAHFTQPRPPAPLLQADLALTCLHSTLTNLQTQGAGADHIQRLRDDLLNACLQAAEQTPGLFTLTAPTGAGKTLSMLAFALRHAALHQLRRIIVVIPYLSIIEQTAQVYRDLFRKLDSGPTPYVLEHHSLAGESEAERDDDSDLRRLMAQNWDAPIIITTSVQCLESLFAHRPGRCRKLHRMARSVILFDEVQTLPRRLAVPTLATLAHLAGRYGSSVVFSTATQPAFNHLTEQVKELGGQHWSPREIVPPELKLFERARRVRVHWPQAKAPETSWEEIAARIKDHDQALCVVNMKRHAWTLLEEIKKHRTTGIFHLSTSMCSAHRQTTLTEVRRRLAANPREECLLVSTQCVEAGVDIDFPVAFRAWGPLDSIAQVAGRCNRNGRRERGDLHLFMPPAEGRQYPARDYKQAADKAWSLLREYAAEGATLDLDEPKLYHRYYMELYNLSGLTQSAVHNDQLLGFIKTLHMPEIAAHYRLIDQNTINVLVPYSDQRDLYLQLVTEAREGGFNREWVRRARPLTVGLYHPPDQSSIWDVLESISIRTGRSHSKPVSDWYIYLREEDYCPDRGLVPSPDLSLQIA